MLGLGEVKFAMKKIREDHWQRFKNLREIGLVSILHNVRTESVEMYIVKNPTSYD